MTKQKTESPKEHRSYSGYLKIPELTSLQQRLGGMSAHDEMQFIIVHQCFELWFRLMIHELDTIMDRMKKGDLLEATRLLKRIHAIQKVMIEQIHILETMNPMDFLKFRDYLGPASGFQSLQFREIEFMSGCKDPRHLDTHADNPDGRKRLESRFAAPSLWDLFCAVLEQRGFAAKTHDQQVESVRSIYRDPLHQDVVLLSEAMIDYDELFNLWRVHHIRMVERMIGTKPGTGKEIITKAYGKELGHFSAQGVGYLERTLNKKFFSALWDARTAME